VDSAFPTGAFTHSAGLEAAWQHGVVRDRESLRAFIRTSIEQTRAGVLKFLIAVWEEDFEKVDAECDLFLNNHIANKASRAQGRALLVSSVSAFDLVALQNLSQRVRREESPGHLAAVFGAVAKAIEMEQSVASSLFLFQVARNLVSVAVRLGIVGPVEGQKLLAEFQYGGAVDASPPVQIAPVLDLLQATQERLYSRLFQS